jgi:delta 1-pyrroline-5-carboxylate dehydrogenase
VLSKLPLTTPSEFEAAVAAARSAFPAWRDTPVPTRARVMLKLQQLIRENWVRGWAGREQPACSSRGWRRGCAGPAGVLGFASNFKGAHRRWPLGVSSCRSGVAKTRTNLPQSPLQDDLARMVTQEQGKTFQDARGDVFRGLGARPAG